jgi:hypothetical protein
MISSIIKSRYWRRSLAKPDARAGNLRIIPFMPGPTDEVDDALSATWQRELDDYLRRLCYLNRTTARYILEHNLTREFLALKPSDVERDTEPQYDGMADVGGMILQENSFLF